MPTQQIVLADYFTKPLQCTFFHYMCHVIMGWDHISTILQTYISSSSEKHILEIIVDDVKFNDKHTKY